MFATGKPNAVSMINGMIAGLVAITPAAGYVDGYGAMAIGVVGGGISWFSLNKLGKMAFLKRVDDTFGVLHTHGVAGLVGGLMVGVVANPDMIEYLSTDKKTPAVSVEGVIFHGNFAQLGHQAEAAAVIIVWNAVDDVPRAQTRVARLSAARERRGSRRRRSRDPRDGSDAAVQSAETGTQARLAGGSARKLDSAGRFATEAGRAARCGRFAFYRIDACERRQIRQHIVDEKGDLRSCAFDVDFNSIAAAQISHGSGDAVAARDLYDEVAQAHSLNPPFEQHDLANPVRIHTRRLPPVRLGSLWPL